MYKTLGILGGMGPAATCDLMEKIIRLTDAADDQHHIRQLVDCNTQIPDRADAILRGGEDPVPEMLKSARLLQAMGADGLLMPCNTAHYFYDRLAAELSIPLLHMPKITAATIRERGLKKAAVLATDATVRTGVYETALRTEGVTPVYPAPEDQKLLTTLIYDGVKSGRDFGAMPVAGVLENLRAQGAEKFILACTELPIAFERLGLYDEWVIDPSLILARAAVPFAGASLRAGC